MKKEKIILQLGVETDTLKAHIQRLKKENYQLHPLDVELLQQKTRQFYELLFELEKEVKPQSIAPPPPVHKEKEPLPPKEKTVPKPEIQVAAPPPVIEKPKEKVEEKKVEKPIEEEAIQAEITLEVAEPEKPAEEKQAEPIKEEARGKSTIEKTTETKSHFDLFSESSTATISDKFTGKEEQSLAEKMQGGKVTDLRQSVGINEKFLFINELFNGDMGRYNKALDELNELETAKGVETFLVELKVQNQWNDDLPAYLKLKDLLERKFK